MDKANENRNSMFKAVDQFFIERPEKIQPVAALVRKVSTFHGLCGGIDSKIKERIASSSGKTKEKQASEDAMLESTFLIKSYLTSFAEDSHNHAILDIASVPEWKLAQMRDTEQKVYATTIYELGMSNSEALAEYGLEPDDLPLLKTRIDEYATRLAQREASSGEGKGLTESLLALISDASKLLDSIDESMKRFRTKDAEFYNQYRAIRAVKDVGTRHKKTDEQPAEPAAAK